MKPNTALFVAVVATAAGQLAIAIAGAYGYIGESITVPAILMLAWGLIIALTVMASRHTQTLTEEITSTQSQHQATLDQVEQLEALNEMLVTLGRTKDAGLAFQGLSRRIGRLVHCDRLGLAVLHENGHEVQAFLSRVSEPERRRRPRPELQFSLERSIFGQVIRTCEPVLIEDTKTFASDFHDASVLASQGFHSLLILPLISRNRAIGAMTVIARQKAAFLPAHREILQPLAEILAFAYVAQHQYLALDRYKAMETTAEITLALATDINSSLQVIGGRCAVLQHEHPELATELDVIATQAERISTLLERLHAAADERLRDTAMAHGSIPASPEEFSDEDALR